MSLLKFISRTQAKVIFDSRIYGISAVYARRVKNENGEWETKTCNLQISPQGNYGTSDRKADQIDGRINMIWCRSADLKFDEERINPQVRDCITYEADGQEQEYIVGTQQGVQTQSSLGQFAVFQYEDAEQSIMKIFTFRSQ